MRVSVSIKNPSSQTDFKLSVPLSENVEYLKSQIAEQYPSKPEVARQKLIYLGRLLQNNTPLAQVFGQCDLSIPQTVHLIISNQPPATNNNATPPPVQQYVNNPPPPQVIQQYAHFQNLPNQPIPNNEWNQNNIPNGPNVAGNNANVNNNNNNNGGGFGLMWKLGLLVAFLSQGGSPSRVLALVVGGIVIYFYLTGYLQVQVPRYVPRRQQRNRNQNRPAGEEDEQNGNDAQNNNGEPDVDPIEHDNRGLLGEVTDLVIPFISSLSPTWNPETGLGDFVPQPPPAQGEAAAPVM